MPTTNQESQRDAALGFVHPALLQPGHVRIVLVGDVVGKPGMRIACQATPWLKRKLQVDVVIVNAENAADGTGLRCNQYKALKKAGVDVVTLGDHAFRKREIFEVLTSESDIVRPANFPEQAPGTGVCQTTVADKCRVRVISLLGRVFTRPIDCPFITVQALLEETSTMTPSDVVETSGQVEASNTESEGSRSGDSQAKKVSDQIDARGMGDLPVVTLIEMHGEATSEKQLMGRYLDGRVSAVLGTHTHVATADEQILPGGTAFQCDVGMTGPMESVLGRKIEPVLQTTLTFEPTPFHVATEQIELHGTMVDVRLVDGRAMAIQRIRWPLKLIESWELADRELGLRM